MQIGAPTQADQQRSPVGEYRARLIAIIVTDQLDVREVAAALPDVDSLAIGSEEDPLAMDAEHGSGVEGGSTEVAN